LPEETQITNNKGNNMLKVQVSTMETLSESDRLMAQEIEKRLADREADIKALAELRRKAKGVTLKVGTTAKGQVGFNIRGLGMPKWFYKQHAIALFGDNEHSKALRQQILDFIAANPELSDKE
jgi:hypothetical protein